MFKIIIAGSREFNDYNFLKSKLDLLTSRLKEDIEIVSGTCKGADLLGEQYAEEKGYNTTRFPADWDKHGKSAGFKRNVEMAEYADACVVFHVNNSKGSQHMINEAKQKKLQLKVYKL